MTPPLILTLYDEYNEPLETLACLRVPFWAARMAVDLIMHLETPLRGDSEMALKALAAALFDCKLADLHHANLDELVTVALGAAKRFDVSLMRIEDVTALLAQRYGWSPREVDETNAETLTEFLRGLETGRRLAADLMRSLAETQEPEASLEPDRKYIDEVDFL